MRKHATALALALLAACGGGGGGGSDGGSGGGAPGSSGAGPSTGNPQSYDNGHPIVLPTEDPVALLNESEVIRLVNEHRVAIGLNALIDAGNIRDVSRAHSRHMIVHAFFAHTNPEGDTPGDRLRKGGINWSVAGENIAAGYATPQAAYDAWMASPGHKENIERDSWSHTGVGYQEDPTSSYRWYWTQNFIRE